MHDLIEGALEEGRVDRGDGLHAFGGESSGERDRVLLRDPDVVKSLRELALELIQARPARHRRGDRDDPLVLPGQAYQRVGEDVRIGRRGRLLGCELAALDVELADPVVLERIRLGGRVAVPLLGHRVDQDGTAAVRNELLYVLHRLEDDVHAVALDRTDVAEAEGLEEHTGREESLDRLLGLAGPVEHVARKTVEKLAGPAFHPNSLAICADTGRADPRAIAWLAVVLSAPSAPTASSIDRRRARRRSGRSTSRCRSARRSGSSRRGDRRGSGPRRPCRRS